MFCFTGHKKGAVECVFVLLAFCLFLLGGIVQAQEKFSDIDHVLAIVFEHARNYPPDFISEAQRDDVEGLLRDALDQLERMLKNNGPDREVLFRLGKASAFAYNLDISGSRQKTDEYFGQLFRLEPDDAEGHLYYGQHLSGRGDFEAALKHLQIAAEGGQEIALNMIGLTYLQMGQPDEAKKYFEELLKQHPGDPQLRMLLDSLSTDGEYEYKLMKE